MPIPLTIMLIDTHTHIYCEEFDDDRDAVVQRAVDAGVELMLLPAIDSATTLRQHQLAEQYPDHFRMMAGLHPTSVGENFEEELRLVKQQLESTPDRYVGIGEIGLDLYWDTSRRAEQEDVLMQQMQLAEQYNKPAALHIRNAYSEFFDLMKKINHEKYNGVMHCFSGTLDEALLGVEMGYYLGIGGVLTYKKSLLPEIVRQIPIECLLLETDAPYLAPVPHRGRRNESAYIVNVAQMMADIKGKSIEYIADATSENARQLFKLTTTHK